jgi:hypothetical protein
MNPNLRATLSSPGSRALTKGAIPTTVDSEVLGLPGVRKSTRGGFSEQQNGPVGARTFARPAA